MTCTHPTATNIHTWREIGLTQMLCIVGHVYWLLSLNGVTKEITNLEALQLLGQHRPPASATVVIPASAPKGIVS